MVSEMLDEMVKYVEYKNNAIPP